MPKKSNKDNPKCPLCNSQTIKWGIRKSKKRLTQKYQCKNNECRKYFTTQPSLQKNKTYNINLIINTISNLNLGYSIKQTQSYFKGKKHNQKTKIPRSTLSYWYNQLKPCLPYHRIRQKIKTTYTPINIIKKKNFTHHNQPFTYQYHQPKLDLFLKHYPTLKHYLENIETLLPKDIFNNSQRISQITKIKNNNQNTQLKTKQNYATKLAEMALQITNNNAERHQIVENLMLKNDTATIATEIPVYLKLKNNTITGHIDILQIRYNKLHILDFKPEKTDKQKAIIQLYHYASALSKLTKISLKNFKCAWFDQNSYYEFYPFHIKKPILKEDSILSYKSG